ncbi:MAG: HAMP domain-containing sensor histidine kinase [Candidatus Acididesulfobacter guangdongensis]|uniref:histidine kinase n=1 Tax=Acididesulfobacter guangdongensis TaxID=2597225 RepID=A0A519BGJ1_ACIG2|nr:MAG: HAMP domain-containing sensor histidine kinase [Candidatus Acididesulfobacter guangdongensis]
MKNFIKNLSIKWKILISSFIVLFITIFLSDLISLFTIYNTLLYRTELKNYADAKNLVSKIKHAIISRNIKDLRYNLKYYPAKTLKNITIYNNRGFQLFSNNYIFPKVVSLPFNDKKYTSDKYFIKNIYDKKKLIGVAAVSFNTKRESEIINKRILWAAARFFIIGFIFILIGLILLNFIVLFIINPLIDLNKNIDKIKNGNYDINIKSEFHDEIGNIINAFNSMALSIKEYIITIEKLAKEKEELNCMAYIGEMSSMVSHEVKNAVYIISSANKYIKNEIESNQALELVNIIDKESDRLNNLSVSFMNFAKIGGSELSKIRLNELILKTLDLLNYEIKQLNIEINTDLQDNIPQIDGNEDMLKQVFINIIINAIDATANIANGKIWILSYFDNNNDTIYLNFEDNGAGIPEDNMKKIFKPFFTTKNSGTGLGLAISYKIINIHKGVIEVKREKGRTIFSIQFKPSHSNN